MPPFALALGFPAALIDPAAVVVILAGTVVARRAVAVGLGLDRGRRDGGAGEQGCGQGGGSRQGEDAGAQGGGPSGPGSEEKRRMGICSRLPQPSSRTSGNAAPIRDPAARPPPLGPGSPLSLRPG